MHWQSDPDDTFTYIGGEIEVEAPLEYLPGKTITLGGKVDRIDLRHGKVQVMEATRLE